MRSQTFLFPSAPQISAPLRPERIKPEAKLTALGVPLRPVEARMEPARDVRDVLTKGKVVYRLVLTYKLQVCTVLYCRADASCLCMWLVAKKAQ